MIENHNTPFVHIILNTSAVGKFEGYFINKEQLKLYNKDNTQQIERQCVRVIFFACSCHVQDVFVDRFGKHYNRGAELEQLNSNCVNL